VKLLIFSSTFDTSCLQSATRSPKLLATQDETRSTRPQKALWSSIFVLPLPTRAVACAFE
jgi:hypothetical protein